MSDNFTTNRITYSDFQVVATGPHYRKHLEAKASFSVEREETTHLYELRYVGPEFSAEVRDSDFWKLLFHREAPYLHRKDLLKSYIKHLSKSSPDSQDLVEARLDLEALKSQTLFRRCIHLLTDSCA